MRGSSKARPRQSRGDCFASLAKTAKIEKTMKMRILFTLTAIALFITEFAMAQPGLPGAPSQAPIDGGLSLLAAAGGAYAIKKLRDKKKANEENIDL